MKRRDVHPLTPDRHVRCSFCLRAPGGGYSFYLVRGLAVCESCIDILSDLLEDDRKAASQSPQRPTPRRSNVSLQQANSPP